MSPFHEIDGPAGDEEPTPSAPRYLYLDEAHLLGIANALVRDVDAKNVKDALRRLEIAEACIRIREALRSGTAP